MKPGDVVALWHPSGRLMTRRKDDRVSGFPNALVGDSVEDLRAVIQEKLKTRPDAMRNILLLEVADWVGRPAESKSSRVWPITTIASTMDRDELINTLDDLASQVEDEFDEGEFWVEVHVRRK